MNVERRPAESLEYLAVTITAAVELGDDLAIDFAFQPDGVLEAPDDWNAAAWIGAAGTSRTARLLVGPGGAVALSAGFYNVWYRVAATPELPARIAGRLELHT